MWTGEPAPPTYTPLGTIKVREGFGPLELSLGLALLLSYLSVVALRTISLIASVWESAGEPARRASEIS